jgi:hypothetical protein
MEIFKKNLATGHHQSFCRQPEAGKMMEEKQ